jgi:hypothetical protein
VLNRPEVVGAADDLLRQEESCRQLAVGPRRAHYDSEGPVVEPDFERLFGRRAIDVYCPRRPADANDVERSRHVGHPVHLTAEPALKAECWYSGCIV